MDQQPNILQTAKGILDSLSEVDHLIVGAVIGALGFLGKAVLGRRRAKQGDALVEAQTKAAESEASLSDVQALRELMEAQNELWENRFTSQEYELRETRAELSVMHLKLNVVVEYVTTEVPKIAAELCDGARERGYCPLANTLPGDIKARMWVRFPPAEVGATPRDGEGGGGSK